MALLVDLLATRWGIGIASGLVKELTGKSGDPNAPPPASSEGITPEDIGARLAGGDRDLAGKTLASLEGFRRTLGEGLNSPLFLSLASALVAPLLLSQIAGMLNEKSLIRPLKDALRPETLQALDVIAAWRRGEFDEKERDRRLSELGYPQEDQSALLRVTEFIAGPQDIIRFAVRDLFDKSQRERLGLDAEVEPVLEGAKDYLFAAGIPEKLLRDFWAAHWELPSPQQGYEMLHRGLIDEDTLDALLKALDYAPTWRDKLKAIAYTPLTRVDVRRMHKLGVLDDAGVVKAFRDIGYDQENAELLLRFTKEQNADPTQDEETFSDREAVKARDLTRADIVGAFEDGLVSKDDASQALSGLGYAPGEVAHIIARAEFATALTQSKRILGNLQKGFVKGAHEESFVRGFMGRLGLPAAYIDAQLEAWKLEVDSNVALPTKAEVLRWYAASRITKDEATDALRNMGYAPKWIEIYLDEKTPSTPGEE